MSKKICIRLGVIVSCLALIAAVVLPLFPKQAHADTDLSKAKLVGEISWNWHQYQYSSTFTGASNEQQFDTTGKIKVSMQWVDGRWQDDGTSRYSGTHFSTGTAIGPGSVCSSNGYAEGTDILWSQKRDEAVAAGHGGDWHFFMDAPAFRAQTLLDIYSMEISGNASQTASGLTPVCASQNWQFTTPNNLGIYAVGTFVGSHDFGEVPTLDFNRDLVISDTPKTVNKLTIRGRLAPQNQPPTVDAGIDQEGTVATPVNLSAIVKDDGQPMPPGVTTVSWEVSSLPEGAEVTFADKNQAGTTARFTKSGTYVLKAVASDGGLSAEDTVSITIGGKPKAAFTHFVNSGGTVEFDATASAPTSGASPLASYEWDFDDGSDIVKEPGNKVQHNFDFFNPLQPVKKHTVKLTAVDEAGVRSDPVSHEVDVCAPDRYARTAQEYSGLVRCVESALPEQSPREILSTMRKLYYGSQDWSNTRNSQWDRIIPCGRDVPNPVPRFDPKLRAALITSSTSNTVFEGDMSHVFTGLEALACPANSVSFQPLPGKLPAATWEVEMPNYHVASWGGDIASAAGQKAADQLLSGAPSDWAVYIGPSGNRASYHDLNADVDGLVINYMLSGRNCASIPAPTSLPVPLSQALHIYYPDPNQPFESKSEYRNRINCFRAIVGSPIGSGKVTNMVNEFALPYYFIVIGAGNISPDHKEIQNIKNNSKEVADIFDRWLSAQ